ncbi:uncharacterized protein LOC123305516 [Chrysoperla carnea]|uniref:uncharacterized protein LOC123305516 n=1 Tax=Chrysoperla carnea TaxID=189513 RepID=UPI001D0695D9|nr:uncharacterized protein LOC123305516 [Chrysoperla carnea]
MSKTQDDQYKTICNTKTLQSQQRGFFLEFAHQILKAGGDEWLNTAFDKIKNDHDRIQHIFKEHEIKTYVCEMLKHVTHLYRQKNAKISQDRRLQAEKIYEFEKDLQKANMIFGQAVLRAPSKEVDIHVDGGLSLAFALWKRSDVLLELKEYAKALSDLQLALKEGLPAKHKAELYWKMARCYMGMGELKKAEVSYTLAEKLETDNDKKTALKKEIQEKSNIDQNLKKPEEPKIKGGSNKKYKNASKLIRLLETPKLGRHFVANADIETGDTLLVEEPYAACLMPEYAGSNCHNCFKRIVAPVGCPQCSGIAFCSTSCQEIACKTYHKYECKIMDFLIGSGMSVLCHLALRMITKHGLEQCLEMYKNKDKLPIYKLCTLSKQRDSKDFLYRTLMAAFMLRCLQVVDFFPNKNINEVEPTTNELQIAELLLLQLQFLQFNAHEIMEPRETVNKQTVKEQPVAIAVYPTASLFNHDCHPSVIRYFHDNKIVLVASRIIKPGEMVSENYGPMFTRMPKEQRSRNLESRYWFKCECQACILAWPILSEIDDSFAQLKCPTLNCTGIFILPDVSGKCRKCGNEPNLDDALIQLTESENKYRQGYDFMMEKDFENAIKAFTDGLNMFYKIGAPPHMETHKAEDYLKTCYLRQLNTIVA